MKKSKYYIMGINKTPVLTEGYVFTDHCIEFGVQHQGCNGWIVTHLETGLLVCSGASRAEAVEQTKKDIFSICDWITNNYKSYSTFTKLIREAKNETY